jgi:tetratricopeptide (TPR) repeat protein
MDILINQPRNRNVRSLLPEALRIKGQALMLNNQISEALHALLEAKSESENLGERREYWKILAGLAEIEQQQGNLEKAAQYHQQAQDTIAYIADHITDPSLLGKFQRLPEIARIMSGEFK